MTGPQTAHETAPSGKERRLRVLFVQRSSDTPQGGDVIYEKRMLAALRERMDVEVIKANRRSRGARIAGAVRHLALPDQTAFGGDGEAGEIARWIEAGGDVVVFSHEYLDLLARRLRPLARARSVPFISIRHNVTSDLLRSFLGGAPGALARAAWRAQERGALRGGLFEGVAVLSLRDKALVREIGAREDVVVAAPGAPPEAPLAPDAPLLRELVIGGSFDWFAKRRDIVRFADEYSRLSPPPGRVLVESSAPAELAAQMRAGDAEGVDFTAAMRFGVITDRFTAGHKLKTSAYLQSNCIVLSFADVAGDFQFDPRVRQFIVRLGGIDDIGPAMDRLAQIPIALLRAEFLGFKAEVARELAWPKQAAALEDLILRVGPGRAAA